MTEHKNRLTGGPAAILLAAALMALQDALVKLMSDALPLWQLFFIRSLITLPMLALMAGPGWRAAFRRGLSGWMLARSGLIVATYVFFYAALPMLSLSLVSAVYYTGPLFILLFSALLLNERAGLGQGVAMLVAFGGVLVVLQPWGGSMSFAALLPLVSALSYALAAVVTRGRIGNVGPLSMIIGLNIMFLAVGAAGMVGAAALGRAGLYPFLTDPWAAMSGRSLGAVLLLAGMSAVIHVALARAYQLGPMAVVAGLDFTYLIFAALWSFVIFGVVPGGGLVIGTILIALAGLYGVLRPPKPPGG